MTFNAFDTIVAPATPVGRSALAIVRIDGPGADGVLARLVGELPEPRIATRKSVRHEGRILDDAVVVRWVAPHSFTGNHTAELTLHGSPAVIAAVLSACVAAGARMAEAGEFTERAVLNGKIDLLQAEAVGDLIDSRTAAQARLSLMNLDGALSRTAASLRERLLHVLSRLEAALDFSDEGYEFITRDHALLELGIALEEVRSLAGTFRRGSATAHGLRATILGRPNAGKSTLLNRLVGSERAIVTAIPGTTRDIVRETIEIGGLPVTLSDTAGLRETTDLVESMGVARARAEAADADVILYLVDGVAGLTSEEEREIDELGGERVLTVFTKSDLVSIDAPRKISAATGEGVPELLAELDSLVRERFAVPENSAAIVNQRQRAALAEAEAALEDAAGSLGRGMSEDIVAVDLYRATSALGALTGAVVTEEILAEIFSKFCIGK